MEKPVLVYLLQIRESLRRKAQNSERWTKFIPDAVHHIDGCPVLTLGDYVRSCEKYIILFFTIHK